MTRPIPKPTTTGERQVTGMPTGVPSIIVQPSIDPSIPRPPRFLDVQAKKIWKSVTYSLYQMGMIGDIDQMMLSVLCQTYADYVDCRIEIAKLKHFYEQEYQRNIQQAMDIGTDINEVLPRNIFVREGERDAKIDPLMATASKLSEQISRLSDKFGMSTASRSAIRLITKVTDSVDPFSQFLDDK